MKLNIVSLPQTAAERVLEASVNSVPYQNMMGVKLDTDTMNRKQSD